MQTIAPASSIPLSPKPTNSTTAGEPKKSLVERSASPDPSTTVAVALVRVYAKAFFENASEALITIREQLDQALGQADPAARADSFGSLYVSAQAFSKDAERAKLRSIYRLSSALLALLKEFLESPAQATTSALNTCRVALEVLTEMCVSATRADLSTLVPQILVVDDDAVTRLAISNSLQTGFAKPMNADSGAAAISLADQVRFHLIFLDISMPGLDGFETCPRIHELSLNQTTPVVFVTTHCEENYREQAIKSGGCGYICKPALPAEIVLTAMTFCFRSRLDQRKPAAVA
jgi:CheY-like chemotaxis protein